MTSETNHTAYWGGEYNRCLITTPQGEQIMLSVPLIKHTNRICYMHRWQHQHWMALVSAYGKTPYFEYYRDYIEPIYHTEWQTIDEMNERIAYVVDCLLRNEPPAASGVATTDHRHPHLTDRLFELGPEANI